MRTSLSDCGWHVFGGVQAIAGKKANDDGGAVLALELVGQEWFFFEKRDLGGSECTGFSD